jgi:hypothetical protein
LFFLVALVFSTRLDIQFTLSKLVIVRALTPILAGFWAVRLSRNEVRPVPAVVFATGIALSLWWVITSFCRPSTDGPPRCMADNVCEREIFSSFLIAVLAVRAGIERLIKPCWAHSWRCRFTRSSNTLADPIPWPLA